MLTIPCEIMQVLCNVQCIRILYNVCLYIVLYQCRATKMALIYASRSFIHKTIRKTLIFVLGFDWTFEIPSESLVAIKKGWKKLIGFILFLLSTFLTVMEWRIKSPHVLKTIFLYPFCKQSLLSPYLLLIFYLILWLLFNFFEIHLTFVKGYYISWCW